MFPSDKLFAEIQSSIFRIEWNAPNYRSHGTGFVIATLRDSQQLILATAKHVLRFPPNQKIGWKAEQFGGHGEVVRRATSDADVELKGAQPYTTSNNFDVGIMTLPRLGDDLQPLARAGEHPVRLISPVQGVSAGTRVAWAGFPGIVEDMLGHPQLCYFEGVVSAMVDRPERILYVVDGHNARGVSGGPVWYWNEEKDRPEVVGIVSSYTAEEDLPGFCIFEPVNPLLYLFHSKSWHPETIGDQVILNNYG